MLGLKYRSTTPRAGNIIKAAQNSITMIQNDKCKRYAPLLKESLNLIKNELIKNQKQYPEPLMKEKQAVDETTALIKQFINDSPHIIKEDKPVLIDAMTSFAKVATKNSINSSGYADAVMLFDNIIDIINSFCIQGPLPKPASAALVKNVLPPKGGQSPMDVVKAKFGAMYTPSSAQSDNKNRNILFLVVIGLILQVLKV